MTMPTLHAPVATARRCGLALLVTMACGLLTGCVSVTERGYWGDNVRWPSGRHLGDAALDAARSPHTWVPLAGALLLGVTDLDDEISDWATDKTPLFGSNADSASDQLRDLNVAAYLATALLAPSDSVAGKVRGLAVGGAALVLEDQIVGVLKDVTGRERPNGQNDLSMPSGHTSMAAASATLAAANLDYIGMPGWSRQTLKISLYGVAAGTGWARVEAEKHYPSDVLVGYAIGQFVARFMQNAFFAGQAGNGLVSYRVLPGGGALNVTLPLR
jgi:membrane-associated phospholipid phosphatase